MKHGVSKRLPILVVCVLIASLLLAQTANASIGHGSARTRTATCLVCKETNATISYGCTNTFLSTESPKTCTITPGICTYVRDRYRTCWTHLGAGNCHSDGVTYNIHMVRHNNASHNQSCVYN